MRKYRSHNWIWGIGAAVLCGCGHGTDRCVQSRLPAYHTALDVDSTHALQSIPRVPPAPKEDDTGTESASEGAKPTVSPSDNDDTPGRLQLPKELPAANTPPLSVPPFDASQPPEQRKSIIRGLYRSLPEVPADEGEGSAVPKLPLASLQQMAVENSPVLQQASADVEELRGKAIQAGLYPNPTVGLEQDTVNTANTAGYNGALITQEFVTAGKLSLAQNAAIMELRGAEYQYRKTQIGLASDVRRSYFRALIAEERVRFHRAMSRLTEDLFQSQIDLVQAGESAPYEPLQLRVLAMQSRNDLLRAENELKAAQQGLAATIGIPEMQPGELEGNIEVRLSAIDREAVWQQILTTHTDFSTAQAGISKSQYDLELQRVTPIPNVTVYGALQHDATSPLTPNELSYNLQVTVPIPVMNDNRGNIVAAEARLIRAQQELASVRNRLQRDFATAAARYESSREIVDRYRDEIIPDQVRTYRAIYEQFRSGAGENIDFSQVVVAQQTLSQVIRDYLDALSEFWSATVDLAELMQSDDLFSMTPAVPAKLEPVL